MIVRGSSTVRSQKIAAAAMAHFWCRVRQKLRKHFICYVLLILSDPSLITYASHKN